MLGPRQQPKRLSSNDRVDNAAVYATNRAPLVAEEATWLCRWPVTAVRTAALLEVIRESGLVLATECYPISS